MANRRAPHLVAANRAHPSEAVSRAPKATDPSNGHMHLLAIVHPDANPRAATSSPATESPAAATVQSASSRHGPDLRTGPRADLRAVVLPHGPKAASANPGPSALPASAPAGPADSASPVLARAASASPAALANPASVNPAAIANPQATAPQPAGIVQPPAGIVPTAPVPRAPPSLQASVLLVPQGAGMQLQARASPAVSASPAPPASPSANLARRVQVRVGLAPQEQGKAAPPRPQVPASRAVPADLANRAQAHHRVVRPPREASVTSNHAASPRVANVRARNAQAAPERHAVNRAVPNPAAKETKARWPNVQSNLLS